MADRETWRGDVIGWGPWRSQWYSICSGHPPAYRQTDCQWCMAGHYVNDLAHTVGHWFYRRHYKLWYWWVNRPNSAERRRLERWFPNLRKGD